jgi:hypothetical protein
MNPGPYEYELLSFYSSLRYFLLKLSLLQPNYRNEYSFLIGLIFFYRTLNNSLNSFIYPWNYPTVHVIL